MSAAIGLAIRIILIAITFSLCGLLADRVARAYGSGMMYGIRLFSSDEAIPVLMSRATEWNVFQIYYWGQDRFGSWPFLVVRLVQSISGEYDSTRSFLQFWQCLWVISGTFAIGALAKQFRIGVMGLYLLVIFGFPYLTALLCDLALWAPWQISALFFAWWSIRLNIESEQSRVRSFKIVAYPAILFFCASLAIWLSPVSGPLLFGLSGLEAVGGAISDIRPRFRAISRLWFRPGLVIAVIILGEFGTRKLYHHTYPFVSESPVEMDWANIASNAQIVFSKVINIGYFQLPVLWPLLLAIGMIGALCSLFSIGRDLVARQVSDDGLHSMKLMILGSWLISTTPLILLSATTYVRLNVFSDRYFVITWLFGVFSGVVTLFCAIIFIVPQETRRIASGLASVIVFAFILLRIPPASKSNEFVELESTSSRISGRMPRVPLLGSYWDTYVFAALQPERTAVEPVPFEGQPNRTRWLISGLKDSHNVLIAYATSEDQPSPWVLQHGTLLELSSPNWDSGAGRTFSLYLNVREHEVPYDRAQAIDGDICSGDSLLVRFSGSTSLTVVMAIQIPKAGRLVAHPIFPDAVGSTNESNADVLMQQSGNLYYGQLGEHDRLMTGVRISIEYKDNDPYHMRCIPSALFVVDELAHH
jgi:hypothetical protein